MRLEGIVAQRQRCYRRISETASGRSFAPNLLLEGNRIGRIGQVWASDLTQVWTGSGWLYLAVVLDVYSRRVIG